MVNYGAQDLGKLLGGAISSANDYKIDFIGTEELADINIVALHTINLVGSYFEYKQEVGSAFQVGHPVNSEVGSSYSVGSDDIGTRTLLSSGEL